MEYIELTNTFFIYGEGENYDEEIKSFRFEAARQQEDIGHPGGDVEYAGEGGVRGSQGFRQTSLTGTPESNAGEDFSREEDGSLRGLPRIKGARFSAEIAEVARKYMASIGRVYSPPATYAPVNVDRAERIANEFEKMEHGPASPDL